MSPAGSSQQAVADDDLLLEHGFPEDDAYSSAVVPESRLGAALGTVSWCMSLLSIAVIAALAVLICADVAMRAVSSPIRGVVELARNGVVVATFLAMPYAMHRGAHIRSGVFADRLPLRARTWAHSVANAAGAAAFALIAWATYPGAMRAWATGEYEGEGALRVPTAPTRTVILLCAVLMVLECLNSIVNIWRARRAEHHEVPS